MLRHEPSTLELNGPRARRKVIRSHETLEPGSAVRLRAESFADHFTQARLFFMSQTEPEQNHIVSALIFELGKVETLAIRERVARANRVNVDVASPNASRPGLGSSKGPFAAAAAAMPTKKNVKPSPPLSLLAKAPSTLAGRVVGCLVTDGADAELVAGLRQAVEKAGAKLKLIAPKAGGASLAKGKKAAADFALNAGPSIFFDAVVLLTSEAGATALLGEAAAIDFIRDAFGHLKVIGYAGSASALFAKAGIDLDA